MKLVNIFVPRDLKTIYAIQEFEKVYLYRRHKVQKNFICLICRTSASKRTYLLNISLERGEIMLIDRPVVTAKSYNIRGGLIDQ